MDHPSSKHHMFVIVAMYYFTKWDEAVPIKSVTQTDIIKLIKEYMIYRSGLHETITADQGTVFIGDLVKQFVQDYRFKIVHYTTHYAQANGQIRQPIEY